MGNEVRWPQGWPHGQLRVAKKPQQEYGQGVAGMPQECPGWAKRLQEWPQARQEWAGTPQEKPWVAELQEMWAVAQPPEAKVSGVAKPPPWVAEPPQPRVGSLAQPPQDAPVQRAPPNLPAGRVNGPAASITTSKVATSLPWWASSTASSSAWSQQASSLSISAGGSYSTCTAGALPRALKLMASPCPATWSPGPPAQIPAMLH